MTRSKEEQRIYLQCQVVAYENMLREWWKNCELNKKTIDDALSKAKRDLAALDIPQLRDLYGVDSVVIKSPWEWDETLSERNQVYLTNDGQVCELSRVMDTHKRLGLRKRKPKRVWFEAEETPRQPALGGWFWFEFTHEWVQAQRDYKYDQFVCGIRHEEYDDAPQIVTQTDVDRIFGGVK